MATQIERIDELLAYLTEEERQELDVLLATSLPIWVPLPGPQLEAYESEADIVFYGGAAGGGKSDLGLGLSLTRHRRSIIFRREGTQLQALVDRLTEILGTRDGYNGQERIWRLLDRQIEFGATKDPGDEIRYQGRPHDLIVFDEICHFLESQVRFLLGWLRTTDAGLRCRALFTGNPPTDSDGEWVIQFFAPWLDRTHPNPAKPGELRWYAMVDGKEVERPDGKPFKHKGKEIRPKSRTFIPSRVTDNPFLTATDYEATLQALPEPLRSQLLNGDFLAGMGDDPWQIIPTAWVIAAQARWTEDGQRGPMDSLGVDPARGGRDESVIAPRYGRWYAPLACFPGKETPDGPAVASLAISALRDAAPIHVDIIGVGGSVYDHLNGNRIHVVGVNGASRDDNATDKTGRLRFRNKRAETWWKFREALDPAGNERIALPPDPRLKADLCAPRWKLSAQGIQVEGKEDLIKRLGRSPDRGDAVVLASIATPKRDMAPQQLRAETAFDVFDSRGAAEFQQDAEFEPYAGR